MTELLAWLRTATPDPGRRDARPAYGVFCAWPWGHHVNVLGRRPAIVDGFNHEGVEEPTRQVWLSRTPEELTAALRAWGARYFVVTNSGGTLLSLLRRTSVEIARPAPDVPSGVVYLDPMYEYAAFRLQAESGFSGGFGHLRPRFVSGAEQPLAVLHEGRTFVASVPQVMAYELVRGARVAGRAEPGADVALTCEVERPGSSSGWEWQARTRAGPDGAFELRVPLAAPSEESTLRVPRPCTLAAGGLPGALTVTIDEYSVAAGSVIAVGPAP
jgi:hypothetical protein